MENKKSNVGWIIITIVLLLIIGGLSFIILKDKGIIKIGKDSNKTETKVEDKKSTTKEEKTKNDNNKVTVDESKIIYQGSILNQDKDFGEVTFNSKKVNVKYVYDEQKLYVGNKGIDIINSGLNNIAVMGNYLVLGLDGSGYRFELYDHDLKLVNKYGSSLGLLTDTTPKTENWIIDKNNLIYYECNVDNTSSTNFKLDTYNLKIDGSKVESVLLETNQGVNCTAQR